MMTNIEILVQNFDILFFGISTFCSIFLLVKGVYNKSIFTVIMGCTLLFFSVDLCTAFLESFFDKNLISESVNFYTLSTIVLYGYSHFILNKRFNLRVIVTLVAFFLFFIASVVIPSSVENLFSLALIAFGTLINALILLKTLFNLQNFSSELENHFSSIEEKDFYGLTFVVKTMIVFNVINLVGYFSFVIPLTVFDTFIIPGIALAYTYVSILLISAYALNKQTNIIEVEKNIETIKKHHTLASRKERNGSEALFQQVCESFVKEQLYLEKDLSLRMLSDKFEVKTTDISNAITDFSGGNFYAFVNKYRVAHFKTLVASKQSTQMSIDGLIESCGSKSKSSFYSHFKKIEGCTPAEYIKRNNLN